MVSGRSYDAACQSAARVAQASWDAWDIDDRIVIVEESWRRCKVLPVIICMVENKQKIAYGISQMLFLHLALFPPLTTAFNQNRIKAQRHWPFRPAAAAPSGSLDPKAARSSPFQ